MTTSISSKAQKIVMGICSSRFKRVFVKIDNRFISRFIREKVRNLILLCMKTYLKKLKETKKLKILILFITDEDITL